MSQAILSDVVRFRLNKLARYRSFVSATKLNCTCFLLRSDCMIKVPKIRSIGFLLILGWSTCAIAAVAPSKTRYFIDSSQEHINIRVQNSADEAYMAQVWLENLEGNKVTDGLSLLPSIFKIEAKGNVLVRLLNKKQPKPQDRESFYYIVVQDIPPNKERQHNVMKIAYRSRIPLFYQPTHIISNNQSRSTAIDSLTWTIKDGVLQANNPSPFYYSITSIDDEALQGINVVPPLGHYQFKSINALPKQYRYVNDFGAFVLINID